MQKEKSILSRNEKESERKILKAWQYMIHSKIKILPFSLTDGRCVCVACVWRVCGVCVACVWRVRDVCVMCA